MGNDAFGNSSRARRLIDRVIDVRDNEVTACLWAAAYFFFLLYSYFLLRPLREAMGLEGGVETLSWLFMGTLVITLALQPLYGWITSRMPRRTFVSIAYRAAIVCLLCFAFMLRFASDQTNLWTGYLFYTWLSAYNMFAVSIFWSVMADTFTLEQGKRLYGFIGIGGTIGAVLGSLTIGQLARQFHPAVLVLISIVGIECAVRCFYGIERAVQSFAVASRRESNRLLKPDLWSGVKEVMQSPYFLTICLYIAFLTAINTFWYFTKMGIVDARIEDKRAQAAFLGTVEFWAQIATLITQLFFTGRLMRLLGVGVTLSVLPLIFLVGFALVFLSDIEAAVITPLVLIVLIDASTRLARHGLSRPARETLFTIVSRDEKYKAKAMIDTFVYRSGDACAALVWRLMHTAGAIVALWAMPIALVWGGTAITLGIMQRKRAAMRDGMQGGENRV